MTRLEHVEVSRVTILILALTAALLTHIVLSLLGFLMAQARWFIPFVFACLYGLHALANYTALLWTDTQDDALLIAVTGGRAALGVLLIALLMVVLRRYTRKA